MALAGGIGYVSGRASPGSMSALTVRQMPPFEVYLSEHSFSEIENTKDKLQALVTEFLTAVRVDHYPSASSPAAIPPSANPSYAVEPGRAIKELERGIEQFKGTEQEMTLIRELLVLLNVQKLPSRWLDVYLAALYTHPTDDLIGRYAKDALAISDPLGRRAEVVSGFDLLRRIPLFFAAKAQIQEALAGANLARLNSSPLANANSARSSAAN